MADLRVSCGRSPIRPRSAALALLAAGAALIGLAGCTEEAIVAVDPDLPGATLPTVEVSAFASDLEGWRDTTYSGFELPGTSGFKVLADRAAGTPTLQARQRHARASSSRARRDH